MLLLHHTDVAHCIVVLLEGCSWQRGHLQGDVVHSEECDGIPFSQTHFNTTIIDAGVTAASTGKYIGDAAAETKPQ